MRDKPEGTFINYHHPTYDSALEEATRLVRKEGCLFIIAMATNIVEPDNRPVIISELLDPGEGIPF
jgi:hypothetical protein